MKIIFMGTPDFAVPSLEALMESGLGLQLVVTQPDRGTGRGRKLAPPPVKKKALELGLPLDQPESARDPIFIKRIEDLSPDLVIVVAFGQILPSALLDIPPLGCINVHGSLLPKYRGAAPIQRAVMNGERTTGITTMRINERMDEGDILQTRSTPVGENETSGELFERLKIVGAELLVQTIKGLEEKTIVPVVQNSAEATYAPKIQKEERLVCWDKPALEIYNNFRGLTPTPGIFSFLNGKRVIISECRPGQPPALLRGTPGEITSIEREGLHVLAGKGETLLIKRVRPEGKREMGVADFLSGHRAQPGDRFYATLDP